MNRTSFAAPGAGPTSDLASLLDRSPERVGRVIRGDAGCPENDLGIEPALEQELSGVVPPAGERRKKVSRRRLLAAFSGAFLCDPSKRPEVGLPGREGPR
jgi:hypothetical protein